MTLSLWWAILDLSWSLACNGITDFLFSDFIASKENAFSLSLLPLNQKKLRFWLFKTLVSDHKKRANKWLFLYGGRYWIWTSDPLRVEQVLYPWANRPDYLLPFNLFATLSKVFSNIIGCFGTIEPFSKNGKGFAIGNLDIARVVLTGVKGKIENPQVFSILIILSF